MCFNLGLNRAMPKDVKIYLPHLSLSLSLSLSQYMPLYLASHLSLANIRDICSCFFTGLSLYLINRKLSLIKNRSIY